MLSRPVSSTTDRNQRNPLKNRLLAAVIPVLLAAPAVAQMQQDHQQHHPAGGTATTQAQPAPAQPPATPSQPQAQMPIGQMMQNMPEQCRAMMQKMPQGCMGMMQQMMQGGMMRGGIMQGQSGQAAATQSEAAKAYMAAMDKMHGPMIQAAQESDPDVAFVKGMIPHHQGAIDMAKVVLQHGIDEQARKWANDVIRQQQREIDEMQEWLKKRGK
jgi:uncharacterized protein (DUF305 family)